MKIFDRLFSESPTINILKHIESKDVPWDSEAILLYIKSGLGKLKLANGKTEKGLIKKFLLLNDIPLVKWHEDDYCCPTCEKLISAGYGIDTVDPKILEIIKSIRGNNATLEENILELTPILRLLEENIYMVSKITLYPTNGVGGFFWDVKNKPKSLWSTCDTYYKLHVSAGYPAYLLPTQTPKCFNEKQVEFYREKLWDGEKLCGLAMYIDGYLCALLDGHHRATACLLEGKEFSCMTIVPMNGWARHIQENKEYAMFGGYSINVDDIDGRIRKKASDNFTKSIKLDAKGAEEYLALINDIWDNYVWADEFNQKAKCFPTVEGLASIQMAGDLSDERIEELLKLRRRDYEDDLDMVFNALTLKDKNRAKKLALKLGKSERYLFMWESVMKYLSCYRDEEVEQFFIDFLINDDKIRRELTKIADDYFRVNKTC